MHQYFDGGYVRIQWCAWLYCWAAIWACPAKSQEIRKYSHEKLSATYNGIVEKNLHALLHVTKESKWWGSRCRFEWYRHKFLWYVAQHWSRQSRGFYPFVYESFVRTFNRFSRTFIGQYEQLLAIGVQYIDRTLFAMLENGFKIGKTAVGNPSAHIHKWRTKSPVWS